MKFIKFIGLLCLICFTFIYTEKIIDVSINQDEIMIKLKELELSNQQFFDVLITRYVSITLPVSEEKKASHLRLAFYYILILFPFTYYHTLFFYLT